MGKLRIEKQVGYIYLPDPEPIRLDGYIYLEHLDAKGDGKPCGKSFISRRKRCSDEKKAQLATDLKAGDAGARSRVEIAKKNQRDRVGRKREVARDKGKKPTNIEKIEKKPLQKKSDFPFEVDGTVAGLKKLPKKVTESQMRELTGDDLRASNEAKTYNSLGDSDKDKAMKRALMFPRKYGANDSSALYRAETLKNIDSQQRYSDKDVTRFADIFADSIAGWNSNIVDKKELQKLQKIDHPISVAGAEYGASIYSRLSDQQKDEFVIQTPSGPKKVSNLNSKSEAVEKFAADMEERQKRLRAKGIDNVEFYRLTGGQGNDYEEPDINFGDDDDDDLDLRI